MMNVIDRRIVGQLASDDRETRIRGLRDAAARLRYWVLPEVLTLTSDPDTEVGELAKETAVGIAQEIVRERRRPFSDELATAAVTSIRRFDSGFVEHHLNWLQGNDADRIVEAVFVVRHFANEATARRVLARFISHPDKRVRATVVLHMGTLASRNSADVLTGYMSDGDNRVKANAVEVIERLKNPTLARILRRFRRDKNNRVRANVLKALHTLIGENIMGDLERMLLDDNPLMRTSAVWVIGEVGAEARRYLSLLSLVVDDEYELLRDNIRIAVRKVGRVPELKQIRRKIAEQDRLTLRKKIAGGSDVEVQTVDRGSYMLAKIAGTMKASTAPSMRIRLEELLHHDGEIVLDLGGVDYIDSSGIALLINMTKRVRTKEHLMYICNCSYTVNELFQLNGLDQQLNVFQNEQEIRDFVVL